MSYHIVKIGREELIEKTVTERKVNSRVRAPRFLS